MLLPRQPQKLSAALGHLGTLSPKFCLHELTCNKLTPPFWETGSTSPTWDWHPPLQEAPLQSQHPPTMPASPGPGSTAPSLQDTPPVPPGSTSYSPPTEPVSTTFLAAEKLWRGTPTAASPAQTLEAHRERLPQDQWTIDELTHSDQPPTLPCVHNRGTACAASDGSYKNNFSTSSFAVEGTISHSRSKASTEHLDHPETNRPQRRTGISYPILYYHSWTP
jgi:hypothetical protein